MDGVSAHSTRAPFAPASSTILRDIRSQAAYICGDPSSTSVPSGRVNGGPPIWLVYEPANSTTTTSGSSSATAVAPSPTLPLVGQRADAVVADPADVDVGERLGEVGAGLVHDGVADQEQPSDLGGRCGGRCPPPGAVAARWWAGRCGSRRPQRDPFADGDLDARRPLVDGGGRDPEGRDRGRWRRPRRGRQAATRGRSRRRRMGSLERWSDTAARHRT